MKQLLAPSLLLLTSAAAAAQSADVIHYDFEAGNAANTASPGVGDGTATAINFVGGIAGSGAAEAQLGARIDSGWQVDLGTSSFTIGMWIDLSVGGNGFQYFFGSSSTGGMRCFCAGAAGTDSIMLRTLNGSGNDVILTGGAPSTGPTHCVWSYDAATLTVNGYVNGLLVATVVQPNPIDYTGTSADFNVMDYTGTEMLPGNVMDDFRVYRRALDANEVMGWFNGVGVGLGTNYCTAAANSTGAAAAISAVGSDVAASNNLTLNASSMPNNQFGIFVVSATQGFVPGVGGSSNGNLCLGGAIGRYRGPGQILSTGSMGSFSLPIDLTAIPQGNGTVGTSAGDTWNFQAWFRDGVGQGSNLTDGIEITFQ